MTPVARPVGVRLQAMRSKVVMLGGLAVAMVTLAACGDGGGTADAPEPTRIPPTNYVTIVPVTTTTGPPTTLGPDAPQPEQTYEIKSGDYAIKIAKAFNVQLADLVTANGWKPDASDFPGPGTIIKIPAGGTVEGATASSVAGQTSTQTSTASGSSSTVAGGSSTTVKSSTSTTGTTIKGGQSNCAVGEYTVKDGDALSLIAKKFDTTMQAIVDVNGWEGVNHVIYKGLKIKIPAKTDC